MRQTLWWGYTYIDIANLVVNDHHLGNNTQLKENEKRKEIDWPMKYAL